ncbi:5'-3' exonuclease H3TH domain-containing protein [Geobacter sp. SVR]|uniref:5'-3' exonuclease H3TH domain-containing protein n=1 Tax=Geobacter sp. SVR TaxID=2495594 RepID=UPI00143EFB02|nr:5'-3' exonuclease H3TH domain-containing protein [Geobacter sp. SVR]BCS54090.1 hypothetical protein GSVR_23980 [Geobacter sp. SVR]GCF87573.1 hypothetical protein GSbR_41730 [Geobacter sp. SVR]
MKRVLLIDFMGSAFYHHHAQDGNLVMNFIRNLQLILQAYKVDKTVILLEGGSAYRKNLLPDYKLARRQRREKQSDADRAAFQKFLDATETLAICLEVLGVHKLQVFGAEADDLAGYLCAILPTQEYQILLMSEDSDWSQLLSRKNTVQGSYKTMAKTIPLLTKSQWSTYNSFYVAKGLTPDQWFEKKMLTGDASDNIPGIDGLGETGATRLLGKYGSLREILDTRESLDVPRLSAKAKAGLADSEAVLKLGYQLMNLRWTPEQWKQVVGLNTVPVDVLADGGLMAPNAVRTTAFTELCYDNGWIDFVDNPEWLLAFYGK